MKRTQEQSENDSDAGAVVDSERPAQRPDRVWHVRMGLLEKKGDNPYGARTSVPVSAFLTKKDDMARYSLVIPAFTLTKQIPSNEDEQRSKPWLWNTYNHPRYFGVLDLDMDLDAVKEGREPLFSDGPAKIYPRKGDIKKDFVARLLQPGACFGDILRVCPQFQRLHGAIQSFLKTLIVPHVTYFSGGGGFRILYYTPQAWRMVTWGHTYALVFYEQELRKLLRVVAPDVTNSVLDVLCNGTDKNIYDADKGTKPDFLAHFDTHIFPHPLDSNFEMSPANTKVMHAGLGEAIRGFWFKIFESIPPEPPPKLEASVAKAVRIKYKHCLDNFPICKKGKTAQATHMILQGDYTSYRCVDNSEDLYATMVDYKKRGTLIIAHEVRSELTAHVLDYDGGPPLWETMVRHDTGEMESPMQAIQSIQHTLILEPGQDMEGLYLSSPPRPSDPGWRGHLHWPRWLLQLGHEKNIVRLLQRELTKRWPEFRWTLIIESPPRLRMAFSDKIDKETGLVEHRPLTFNACFDVQGNMKDVADIMTKTSDTDLLKLTTLRFDKRERLADAAKLSPSLYLVDDHTNDINAKLYELPEHLRKSVESFLNDLLTEIRRLHNKPKAFYYQFASMKIYIGSEYRRSLTIGLLEHGQCGENSSHRNNNVRLIIFMDQDAWELRCYKKGCIHFKVADYNWGRGNIDTSALRAAWPYIPPPVTTTVISNNTSSDTPMIIDITSYGGEPFMDGMDHDNESMPIEVKGVEKKKKETPIPFISPQAQAAAQSVLQMAAKWAEDSGSTSIYLKRVDIQKHCDLVGYGLKLAQPDENQLPAWHMFLAALRYQSRVPCQVLWSKWDTERALVNVALLVHEAADKETMLWENVPPLLQNGRIKFVDLDPMAIYSGRDVDVVAAEIIERGPESVTLVTLSPYASNARKMAIYAALKMLLPTLQDKHLPPYETLETINQVAKHRHIIVDQAHFLGTNEHVLWLKQLPRYRGVTLMGSVHIQTPRPGMTLNALFPQTQRAAQGEAGLRMALCILVTERPGEWLCESTFSLNPGSLDQVLCPRATTECVVFLDRGGLKHKKYQVLKLQYKDRMLTCPPGMWALQCMEMAKHPEYTYRVVISQQTLERLTLHDWMLLLLIRPQGFRADQLSCHLVGDVFTKELDVYFLKHIRTKVVHHPRRLAGVRPGQFLL
jgi:hypothetical protein